MDINPRSREGAAKCFLGGGGTSSSSDIKKTVQLTHQDPCAPPKPPIDARALPDSQQRKMSFECPRLLENRPIVRLFLVILANGMVSMMCAAVFIELEGPAQQVAKKPLRIHATS